MSATIDDRRRSALGAQREDDAMLKGLGALGDLGKMMGQARELQEKMTELQAKIEALEVDGRAGGGMVVATVSGKGRLQRLVIDPALMSGQDKTVLEDLIVTAVADAQEKASAKAQEEMQTLTAGLPFPLPGMPGMGGQ